MRRRGGRDGNRRDRFISTALLGAALTLAGSASAQAPFLVKDINTAVDGSSGAPTGIAALVAQRAHRRWRHALLQRQRRHQRQ